VSLIHPVRKCASRRPARTPLCLELTHSVVAAWELALTRCFQLWAVSNFRSTWIARFGQAPPRGGACLFCWANTHCIFISNFNYEIRPNPDGGGAVFAAIIGSASCREILDNIAIHTSRADSDPDLPPRPNEGVTVFLQLRKSDSQVTLLSPGISSIRGLRSTKPWKRQRRSV
jgi:hypothetical protein